MNRSVALALATVLSAGWALTQAAEKKAIKPYPLDTCAVSEEKLGSMGEAFVFAYEGQQVKLCCKSCQKDFNRDPKKYLAKIDEAAKRVKKYQAKTCVISGEPLRADAPASIYQGQEFKFCCTNCQKKFDQEPAKYAGRLPKS